MKGLGFLLDIYRPRFLDRSAGKLVTRLRVGSTERASHTIGLRIIRVPWPSCETVAPGPNRLCVRGHRALSPQLETIDELDLLSASSLSHWCPPALPETATASQQSRGSSRFNALLRRNSGSDGLAINPVKRVVSLDEFRDLTGSGHEIIIGSSCRLIQTLRLPRETDESHSSPRQAGPLCLSPAPSVKSSDRERSY